MLSLTAAFLPMKTSAFMRGAPKGFPTHSSYKANPPQSEKYYVPLHKYTSHKAK